MFESGEARPFDLVPVALLALPISKMHPSSTAERLALRIGNVGQNGQTRHMAASKAGSWPEKVARSPRARGASMTFAL